MKVVKNKVAAPFRKAEFNLIHGEGISQEGEILILGEQLGLVQKSGASYAYGEVKLGRGYDATRLALKEDAKLRKEILKEITKKLKEKS